MMFRLEPLPADDAGLAFPLVQAAGACVGPAAWQAFVEACLAPKNASGAGLLALRDQGGVICGILAYSIWHDLQAGPIFRVELFAAADILNTLQPARTLLDLAEARAHELNCCAIHIRLFPQQALLASRMPKLGFGLNRDDRWTKCIGGAA